MTFAKTFRKGDRVVLDGAFGSFQRAAYGNLAVVVWEDGNMSSVDYKVLQHAPVRIVGPKPTALPSICPDCGGALTIDSEAIKYTPVTGSKPTKKMVLVAACGGCEYIQEVRR